MEQFLLVAAVHFLALLSPGPDFFLIARTAIHQGWRIASGACIGVALANGVYIALAFSGVAKLQSGSVLFQVIQVAGSVFLLYVGTLFVRHAGAAALPSMAEQPTSASPHRASSRWARAFALGGMSALLNPKNALFYASLAAMLSVPGTTAGTRVFYGLWMFSVVLGWDLLVAGLVGRASVMRRFSSALPWIERLSGVLLIALALAVLGGMML